MNNGWRVTRVMPRARRGTPGINRPTFEATHLYDPLFPRVPSAGILFEF